jgi:hypothetical protein
MIEPAPQTPGERPLRAPADPLQMSVAEKLACEWEARHDVAARGRIADVAPVQHYLTHARCEDNRHPPAGAHRPRPEPAARDADGDGVPLGLRGWLRWGDERGAPDSSGLPHGC